LIAGSDDCQRLALINFIRDHSQSGRRTAVSHKINNQAFFSKVDFALNDANQLAVSYNFDYSKNTNQTFDVATYGNSANGTEGPSKINVVRVNLISTISPTKLNEAHFSYSRELRPRAAVPSNVPADTAMGLQPLSGSALRSFSNRTLMNYSGARRRKTTSRSSPAITT
jgi:hypothetical protein